MPHLFTDIRTSLTCNHPPVFVRFARGQFLMMFDWILCHDSSVVETLLQLSCSKKLSCPFSPCIISKMFVKVFSLQNWKHASSTLSPSLSLIYCLQKYCIAFKVYVEQAICLQKLCLCLKTPPSHCEKDGIYQTTYSISESYKKVKLDTTGSKSPTPPRQKSNYPHVGMPFASNSPLPGHKCWSDARGMLKFRIDRCINYRQHVWGFLSSHQGAMEWDGGDGTLHAFLKQINFQNFKN